MDHETTTSKSITNITVSFSTYTFSNPHHTIYPFCHRNRRNQHQHLLQLLSQPSPHHRTTMHTHCSIIITFIDNKNTFKCTAHMSQNNDSNLIYALYAAVIILKLTLPLLKGRIYKFSKSIQNTRVSFLHNCSELFQCCLALVVNNFPIFDIDILLLEVYKYI